MYGWSEEEQACISKPGPSTSSSQSRSTARKKERRRERPDSDVDTDSDDDTVEPSASTQQASRVQTKPWLIEFEKYLRMPEETMPITKEMDLIHWWGVRTSNSSLIIKMCS